jgi:hypothetical protein
MKAINPDGIDWIREYEDCPSIRFLCKKFHMGNRTVRRNIIKAGGILNFKKGSTANYKPNKGSFFKDQTPWNKNKEMDESFREMRRRIMDKSIEDGTYIAVSLREGVAEKISMSKMGEGNWMFGRVGKQCPSWMGGLSMEPYASDFNKQLKVKIRERDSYTCYLCGNSANHVHHIDYDKQNSAEDNLITLCPHCHLKTNINREWWTNMFQEEITCLKLQS